MMDLLAIKTNNKDLNVVSLSTMSFSNELVL